MTPEEKKAEFLRRFKDMILACGADIKETKISDTEEILTVCEPGKKPINIEISEEE